MATMTSTTLLTHYLRFMDEDVPTIIMRGEYNLCSKLLNSIMKKLDDEMYMNYDEYFDVAGDYTRYAATISESCELDYTQRTTNTVNPTVTYPETSDMEFSIADATATLREEITITVTTKNLDNGKIVLKVNGKTVKASDGKLYAKVTGDTVTFTYTVPKTLKAGEYSIKAVYTSGTIKLEDEAVLTVNL